MMGLMIREGREEFILYQERNWKLNEWSLQGSCQYQRYNFLFSFFTKHTEDLTKTSHTMAIKNQIMNLWDRFFQSIDKLKLFVK